VRAAYGNYFPQVSLSYMYDWGWMRTRAWESQAEGTRMRGDGAQGYSVSVAVLTAAEKSVEASQKGPEQAEEEARIIRERFESGRGIQLEVLDAQVALTRARFNAVNALAEYQGAQAMWLRAIGRIR
jgi:hypothetical protein